MGQATYKLAFKGIHYAKVSVSAVATGIFPSLAVSPTAFEWLKEEYGPDAHEWAICDDYRAAAVDGARFALGHIAGKGEVSNAAVVIDLIHAHPAQASADDVSFACCMAVWTASGVEASVKMDRSNWHRDAVHQ